MTTHTDLDYQRAIEEPTAALEVHGGPWNTYHWRGPVEIEDDDGTRRGEAEIAGSLRSWTHGDDRAASSPAIARAWWRDRANSVELTHGYYFTDSDRL